MAERSGLHSSSVLAAGPCLPAHVLEQFLADTLPEPFASAAAEHVRSCARCQVRLDQLADRGDLRQWLSSEHPWTPGPSSEPALGRALDELHAALQHQDVTNASGKAWDSRVSFLAPPQQDGDLGMLGPYRIQEEVGRGGMGIVFRAFDTRLERVVAVKALRPEMANKIARARFLREARAAAGIRHDHVVSVHVVESPAQGPPYIVMEYLAGPTLAELIRSKQHLEPREAAAIIGQVAEGLAAAHAAGLIHRDVKPSNILLDPATERAKITDFGLVRQEAGPSSITRDGTIAGTPAYMSPEQVNGLEALDARTDVYSLGVTLYEALTGVVPFRGTFQMLLRQVIEDEPMRPRKLNEAIPRDLETICLKAMAKEPARRYRTAQEFGDDLGRWQRGEPIRARPAGPAERIWRWSRRNRLVASLTAALVLVFLAGFASVTWQWRRAEANYQDAEANFYQAYDVLHTFFGVVWDGGPRDLPPSKESLQRAMLGYFQSMRQRRSGDPNVLFQLAAMHHNLGNVTSRIGKLDEAQALYREAEALLQEVAREHPEFAVSRSWLAANHLHNGLIQHVTGQMNEALQSHQKALAIQQQLVHEHHEGDHAWYERNLALSYRNIGNVYATLCRTAEARDCYQQARAIQERLVREDPRNDSYLERLADTDHKTGLLCNQLGQSVEALQFLKQARSRQELLVQRQRGEVLRRRDLARTHLDLAILFQTLGPQADMVSSLDQARNALEALVRDNPKVTDFQRNLAEACLHTGNLQRQEGQHTKAMHYLEWARDICQDLLRDNPAVTQSRVILADSYASIGLMQREMGQPAEALRSLQEARSVWETLVKDHPDIPGFRHGLARACWEQGALQRAGNQLDAARQSEERALRLQEQLVREFPDIPAFRIALGRPLQPTE
jgi:serine/threonine-protein kinase